MFINKKRFKMIEFYVILLKANKKQSTKAMKNLAINCTYVDGDYWIFEGSPSGLLEEGIKFTIISEGIVPSLGGLNKNELIDLCKNNFGVDIC